MTSLEGWLKAVLYPDRVSPRSKFDLYDYSKRLSSIATHHPFDSWRLSPYRSQTGEDR